MPCFRPPACADDARPDRAGCLAGCGVKAAPPIEPSTWATSCYGQGTDTTPMQLSTLREHLHQCSQPGGRLGALRNGAQVLHGFLLGRLVTTATVVLVAVGAAWLIWS